jgi:glycosyltransferase involved in cell wall biosynthesis
MTAVCLVVQGVYDVDPRVRRKAEALASAGYEVDVLALRPASGSPSYTLNRVHVRTLLLRKKRGTLWRYGFEYAAFFLWAAWRLHVDTVRRRYAVIDVNTLPDFLIFAALFTRFFGAKLVLDMHEITPEFYLSKYGVSASATMLRLLKFLERVSFTFADRVITINQPVEDLLVSRGLPRAKSTIMMNAADEARLAPRGDTPAPDPTKFVMIYHGTLTRLYGLDLAIEAFALAHSEMPNARLWIVGDGPESPRLAELSRARGVDSRVRLTGPVPSSDIPAWLAQSDAGVLPIRRDAMLDYAFPNKLPEYIISHKPVIVSRLKAIRHQFSEEAVAYAEPNDPADLAVQMIRVYRDEELRKRLAANAAREYFCIRWDVMKSRYLALLEEMLGAPVPSRAPGRAALVR